MGEIAIIMTGCGRYDGTDAVEAVSTAIVVEKLGYKPMFYSFDKNQNSVYDHVTSTPLETEPRNMLQESWRLARGLPTSIQSLDVGNTTGVIMPGGVGILRNLTNLGDFLSGKEDTLQINEDLQKVLEEVHSNSMPIGVISHSALLPAVAFKEKNVVVSFGDESSDDKDLLFSTATNLGAKVEEMSGTEVCCDPDNKIVSTPGFLSPSASYAKVHDSIEKLVDQFIQFID